MMKRVLFCGLLLATGMARADSVVTTSQPQTLSNKTLTAPAIGTISNGGTLTLPTTTDTLVGRATTDTLTNKSLSGGANSFSNIGAGALDLGAGLEDDGSGNLTVSDSVETLTANSGDPPLDCPSPNTAVRITNNDAGTLQLSATPQVGCTVIVNPSNFLGHPLYVDFNGVQARFRGLGGHNVPGVLLQPGKENGTCAMRYTGVEWEEIDCSWYILIGSIPTGLPPGPHGQVQLSYDSGAGGFWIKPYKGLGLIETGGYTQRVLPAGLFISAAGTTSNAANHILLQGQEILTVNSIADNGSGHIRLTVVSSAIPAGDQGDLETLWGLSCFPAANGLLRYVGVDSTHVDLPDVSSTGLSGSCAGNARSLYASFSTSALTADQYGVQGVGGQSSVGDVMIGASHAVLGVSGLYNGADPIGFAGAQLSCSDLTFSTGGGTSPTCTSVVGDDRRFRVNFTMGTSPTAGAVVFTVTFKTGYNFAPICAMAPENALAITKANVVGPLPTATTVALTPTGVGSLAASQAYQFSFLCSG